MFRDTSWNNLINNMEFAVTATAYRLADLISLLPDTFSGSGAQFSQEELAAIGYNTPVPNMQAVATGQFRHDNGVPDVMGPKARSYLYNDFIPMWGVADKVICHSGYYSC